MVFVNTSTCATFTVGYRYSQILETVVIDSRSGFFLSATDLSSFTISFAKYNGKFEIFNRQHVTYNMNSLVNSRYTTVLGKVWI